LKVVTEVIYPLNFLLWIVYVPGYQRWSDSGFLVSDPILCLKNGIRIRNESSFGWNHTIHIQKLAECIVMHNINFLCCVCFALRLFWPCQTK